MILVGHSTGGLVIKKVNSQILQSTIYEGTGLTRDKKAYVLSVVSQVYNRIACAIQSFIFLSTPHRPLDASSFKKWRKINPCLTSKPAMDATLAFLTDQFQRVHRNKRVFSFVESGPTSSIKRGRKKFAICSHETSVLGFPREIVVSVSASHHSITKFKSPNDSNYATFYRYLVSALREIREAQETREEPLIPPPAYSRHVATYIPHQVRTYIPHSTHIPHWPEQPIRIHATGRQRRAYVPTEWA